MVGYDQMKKRKKSAHIPMRIALYFHYRIFFARNGLKSNYDWIKKVRGFCKCKIPLAKTPSMNKAQRSQTIAR
jgi:hypothetical protein